MTGADPYVDDNGVLLNSLGLTSADALERAEADLSNGRAQRAFLGQLARDAGWRIAWSELDRERNDAASAAGLHGDMQPLLALLEDLVRPR
jgi:fido (protein-threonine AMPylation protein)